MPDEVPPHGKESTPADHPDAIVVDGKDPLISVPHGYTTSVYGHIHSSPVNELEQLYEELTEVLEDHDPEIDAYEERRSDYIRFLEESRNATGDYNTDSLLTKLMNGMFMLELHPRSIGGYESSDEELDEDVLDEISEQLIGKSRKEATTEEIIQTVERSLERYEKFHDYDSTFIRHAGFAPIIAHFTIAVGAIEHRTSRIMRETIFRNDYRENDELDELLHGKSGLGVSDRRKWLHKLEIIGDGLNGNIREVIKMRNKIVHGHQSPPVVPYAPSEIREIARKAIQVNRTLTDIMMDKIEE